MRLKSKTKIKTKNWFQIADKKISICINRLPHVAFFVKGGNFFWAGSLHFWEDNRLEMNIRKKTKKTKRQTKFHYYFKWILLLFYVFLGCILFLPVCFNNCTCNFLALLLLDFVCLSVRRSLRFDFDCCSGVVSWFKNVIIITFDCVRV